MFNWIMTKFNKPKPEVVKNVPQHLTKKERLQAILVSYHFSKISLEQATNLIYVWKLRSGE